MFKTKEMEIYCNISDLWFFKKLRKNLIKINSKWFLSTTVAYRYYSPTTLNHNPIEFAVRKQGAIPD